ncbi:universal stress protein [Streptomyces sp. NBC_01283]|uniref:universal stress protein n=1 Tax=Streptomyces sp. NBC_01283 TaxID=2903812 RepID=UPI00352C347E|nr:universal stress protein [Streptomyces sp. NBC_01283]
MLRHVVTGIDGSTESLAAAHWAAREALRRGSSLTVVHGWVWHPHAGPSVPADSLQREWAEQTLERAENSVRAAHPGLQIAAQLVGESSVAALLAATEEAELLVLGSRGLGGVMGFVMGSVSQRAIAKATCPVVLVRAGESVADEHFPAPHGISPDEIVETPYRDVVLGLDTSHPCDGLIEFAFDSARRRHAALHAIHAFGAAPDHVSDGGPVPTSGRELLTENERTVTAALRAWREKYPEVPVTETVCEGRAATALVRASATAALVVVGRQQRDTRVGMHVGPVAHAVLHHASCPVAVVPHA